MRIFLSVLLARHTASSGRASCKTSCVVQARGWIFRAIGRLGAGESARLDFSAAEMNDVLKSLTINDKSGGKISGLRYDSKDVLGHKLEEFPFTVGEAQPLSGMLDQLKGARLEIKLGAETVSGVIVNGRMTPAASASRSASNSPCCSIAAICALWI